MPSPELQIPNVIHFVSDLNKKFKLDPKVLMEDPGKVSILEDLVYLSLEQISPPRYREILENHYGLFDGIHKSYVVVSRSLEPPVSRTRIYQIVEEAKSRIRRKIKPETFDIFLRDLV